MKGEAESVGAATIGTGAVLTAAVASACCVGPALGPVFLAAFGASGLAAVAGLRPYAPFLFLASAAMLAFAIHRVYFRRAVCSTGAASARRLSAIVRERAVRGLLLVAVLIWVMSLSYSVYGYLHE